MLLLAFLGSWGVISVLATTGIVDCTFRRVGLCPSHFDSCVWWTAVLLPSQWGGTEWKCHRFFFFFFYCYCIYCTFAKKGSWVVHLTLGLDWGIGWYSRYQGRSLTQKSAQVNYPWDLHNTNSSYGYYWFQPYSGMGTNREWRRLAIGPILHRVLLTAAVLSGRGCNC